MLAGVADAVLPAVLSLLRSRSREVIKAVLGFVKVRLVQSGCFPKTLPPLLLVLHSGPGVSVDVGRSNQCWATEPVYQIIGTRHQDRR